MNGFHFSHELTSRVINVNPLKTLSLPNLVKLNLRKSNVNRVSIIFEGDLPNLKSINFEGCKGIMDSDIASFKGVPNLGKFMNSFLLRLFNTISRTLFKIVEPHENN